MANRIFSQAIASHFQPKLPEVASNTSELPENLQNFTQSELTEQVNQHWLNQKQGYLGSIRGLADQVVQKPEVTPDDTDLTHEIDSILGELGKKLIV